MSTTLAVLLCQLCLPNSFALTFWFPECNGFVLLLWIVSSNRALMAVAVDLTCGLEAQPFLMFVENSRVDFFGSHCTRSRLIVDIRNFT